jgi:hypothetical protein
VMASGGAGELFATTTSQHLLMALQIAPNVEVKAAAISAVVWAA